MIKFTGLGHINVVVDNIDEAREYYSDIFHAEPKQIFPRFKNVGFAKSAGFLENPEDVDVSILFMEIPGTNLYLEIMEYHEPRKISELTKKNTYEFGGPRHIALKVTNIDEAFAYLQTKKHVTMINEDKDYKPVFISPIQKNDFHFFDPLLENNEAEKGKVCSIIEKIRYFYFIDKYGIQWELEQGHAGVGD